MSSEWRDIQVPRSFFECFEEQSVYTSEEMKIELEITTRSKGKVKARTTDENNLHLVQILLGDFTSNVDFFCSNFLLDEMKTQKMRSHVLPVQSAVGSAATATAAVEEEDVEKDVHVFADNFDVFRFSRDNKLPSNQRLSVPKLVRLVEGGRGVAERVVLSLNINTAHPIWKVWRGEGYETWFNAYEISLAMIRNRIAEHRGEGHTLVLLVADDPRRAKDEPKFLDVVQSALQSSAWSVELWTWKQCLREKYLALQDDPAYHERFSIRLLDEHRDIILYDLEYSANAERTERGADVESVTSPTTTTTTTGFNSRAGGLLSATTTRHSSVFDYSRGSSSSSAVSETASASRTSRKWTKPRVEVPFPLIFEFCRGWGFLGDRINAVIDPPKDSDFISEHPKITLQAADNDALLRAQSRLKDILADPQPALQDLHDHQAQKTYVFVNNFDMYRFASVDKTNKACRVEVQRLVDVIESNRNIQERVVFANASFGNTHPIYFIWKNSGYSWFLPDNCKTAMKIRLQNLLKTVSTAKETPTLVLVTGDGQSEAKPAFYDEIRHALRSGWKVELLCWKAGLVKSQYLVLCTMGLVVRYLDDFRDVITFHSVRSQPTVEREEELDGEKAEPEPEKELVQNDDDDIGDQIAPMSERRRAFQC